MKASLIFLTFLVTFMTVDSQPQQYATVDDARIGHWKYMINSDGNSYKKSAKWFKEKFNLPLEKFLDFSSAGVRIVAKKFLEDVYSFDSEVLDQLYELLSVKKRYFSKAEWAKIGDEANKAVELIESEW